MQHSKLIKKLVLLTLGMFAFAFALVPLYDVFCDITGLNGKPEMVVAKESKTVAEGRSVTVSFTTHSQSQAPFSVESVLQSIEVVPGKLVDVKFLAKNLSGQERVMQAIPSVSPGKAAKYLHKMACFCFDQQPLIGHEEAEFVLRFYVDTELPEDVEELTLSYALFDITERVSKVSAAEQPLILAHKEFINEP
ncbi:cytochrome c oxidase assembly protein [Pseudoalteromonas sp. T1lg65]|uniref:cytochrome c oxidase assembly protein n=1 Tax=Pseudoalteromonas sp. T1lg65 TaxID=2077101 RepID=UPI003F799273